MFERSAERTTTTSRRTMGEQKELEKCTVYVFCVTSNEFDCGVIGPHCHSLICMGTVTFLLEW